MKAKLMFVSEQIDTKPLGPHFNLRFQGEDGKPYHTSIRLNCHNWPKWEFIFQPGFDKNIWLEGLAVKADNLLNADFPPERPQTGSDRASNDLLAQEKAAFKASEAQSRTMQTETLFDSSRWDKQRDKLAEARRGTL